MNEHPILNFTGYTYTPTHENVREANQPNIPLQYRSSTPQDYGGLWPDKSVCEYSNPFEYEEFMKPQREKAQLTRLGFGAAFFVVIIIFLLVHMLYHHQHHHK